MRESEYLREGDGTSTIVGAGKPKRKRGAEQSSMYSHSIPPNPDYDEDDEDDLDEDVGEEDAGDEYEEENPSGMRDTVSAYAEQVPTISMPITIPTQSIQETTLIQIP